MPNTEIFGGEIVDKPLKLLRYNTGNDKKAFVESKKYFDAVIFNATIVAYSGPSVADLVSVHKNQYIIDPQTHIFQHDISAILSKDKKEIKKSVAKYLDELPDTIKSILVRGSALSPDNIEGHISELVSKVYAFETEYVLKYIKDKEYDKYLEFAGIGPKPRLVVAPYFMLKEEYTKDQIQEWMSINKKCLHELIATNKNVYDVATQLVIDQSLLLREELFDLIKDTYSKEDFKYIFLWIDNLDTFAANDEIRKGFYRLLEYLNHMGLKPLMAYGGFDSIFLCNKDIKNRLYGVAQSVGYGEARNITPVGGGLPTNKYYFLPIHRRLKFDDAANILYKLGYFSQQKSDSEYAEDYYTHICGCEQCHKIIRNNINNFNEYNDSIPFVVKGRYGDISRNRPTTNANLIAANHFLFCKVKEWEDINSLSLEELKEQLLKNYTVYCSERLDTMRSWCEIYAR